MPTEVVDIVDPSQYPGFLPVRCEHQRVRAWASDPITWETPPIESCEPCEASLIVSEG